MLGILRVCVRIYQILLSPFLHWLGGPGSGCRFEPSCSEYFLQAIQTHGAGRGSWLGLNRIARCHPWGGQGHDPIPTRMNTAGIMTRPGCE